MKKVLVTGGSGFIGSHVVRQLLQQGRSVRVFHLPSDPLINLQGLPVELVAGDLRRPDDVRRGVAGCRQLYHLAALYTLWEHRPQLCWDVNVIGTRNVLQAALNAGVERVVYTSSIAVYGGQGIGKRATERSLFALGPTGDAYSASKYHSHQLAQSYARRGLDLVTVAPTGPVGPGDVGPTPTGRLILMALNAPLLVGLETSSNMADVRDMAQGHLLAFERGRRGQSYLLGNEDYNFDQLVSSIQRCAGTNKPLLKLPERLVAVGSELLKLWSDRVSRRAPLLTPAAVRIARLGLRADCSRAFEELGMPRTPLDTSIRDAVTWFANNGYVKNTKTLAAIRRATPERQSAHRSRPQQEHRQHTGGI